MESHQKPLFADQARHLLEFLRFVVRHDPAREIDGVRVPVPVKPFAARHGIQYKLKGTDQRFKPRTLLRSAGGQNELPALHVAP